MKHVICLVIALFFCFVGNVNADWTSISPELTLLPESSDSDVKYDSTMTLSGKIYLSWYEKFDGFEAIGNTLFVYSNESAVWDVSADDMKVEQDYQVGDVSVTTHNNDVYLAWMESNPLGSEAAVYVKKYNGASWTMVGNSLNATVDVRDMKMRVINNTLFLGYRIYNSGPYVYSFNGIGWDLIGNNLGSNVSAWDFDGLYVNAVYLIWSGGLGSPTNTASHVLRYNGTGWDAVGSSIRSTSTTGFAYEGKICVTPADDKYVFWREFEGSTLNYKYYFATYANDDWELISGVYTEEYARNILYSRQMLIDENDHLHISWIQGETIGGPIYTNYNTLNHHIRRYFNDTWQTTSQTFTPGIGIYDNPDIQVMIDGEKYYRVVQLSKKIKFEEQSIPAVIPTSTPGVNSTPTVTPTPTLSNHYEDIDLEEKGVLAFPNPAKDRVGFLVHVDGEKEVSICIYNIAGDKISEIKTMLSGKGQIVYWDCKDVAPGLYLVRLLKDGIESGSTKIAIRK